MSVVLLTEAVVVSGGENESQIKRGLWLEILNRWPKYFRASSCDRMMLKPRETVVTREGAGPKGVGILKAQTEGRV